MLDYGMFVAALAVVVVTMLVCGLIAGVHQSWQQTPELEAREGAGGFGRWTVRGLGVPLALITIWNLMALGGPVWGWVPLAPVVRGLPALSFFASTAWAGFWIAMIWAGFTWAWLFPNVYQNIRRRDEWGALAWVIGIATGLLLAIAVWMRSGGLICLLLVGGVGVLFHWSLPLIYRPSVSYARAIGRLKRGHYAEAEKEVLRQLEEKADDYEGWMMLAQLYAEQFGQLAEADQTVRELCEQPGLSPFHVSQALTRLADWHLNRGDNPAAARAVLEEISRRCEGTPFARTAENRLRQLPVDAAELREQRQPRVIRLPSLREDAPPPSPKHQSPLARSDALTEVTSLKARLEARPDDLPLRLRLACTLAERLGQMESALAQLRLVRAAPEVTPSQDAETLALEASWRLNLLHDESAARQLLDQLLTKHPHSPQAVAARRQLELLDHPEFHRAEPPAPPSPPPRIVIRLPTRPEGSTE